MKAVLLLAWALWARPAVAVEIQVFHTNDVHGRVIPRAAALAAYLRKQKGPRLLVDAGDWFQGSAEGHATKGDIVVDAFNALGYDGVAPGNHDFDFGLDNLVRLAGRLRAPVLAANVYETKSRTRPPWAKPWIVKDVAGIKVGLFGLLTTRMPSLTFPQNYKGLEFRDEIAEARDAVAQLRKQGATVIVAVGHVGFQDADARPFTSDQVIAREVPGIDLIVGGHTHSALKQPFRDPVNGTLVAQAGQWLAYVGRVVLTVDDRTKRVVSSRGELAPLSVEAGEDPAMAALLARYEPAIRAEFDVVVATAAQALRRDRFAESPLGEWLADCARARWGTDVALQGYIPADLPAGPVTKRSILEIVPYDNRAVTLAMRGRDLMDAFDRGVDRSRHIMNVSGARFTYDASRPAGSRLLEAEVAGRPLDPGKLYTVAADDYLVKGGADSPFARAEKRETKAALTRDVVLECARRQKLVVPPAGGRIKKAGEAL